MRFDNKAYQIGSFAKVNLALKVTGLREDGYHTLETVMQKVSLSDMISLSWRKTMFEPAWERDGNKKAVGLRERTSSAERTGASDEPVNENRVVISLVTNKHYIPRDRRNLAYKGALAVFRELDRMGIVIPMGRLDIDVRKLIPVAAGLGGGSSNAAAVMIALNRMWGLGIKTKRLCQMGAELGADVPFCVLVHDSKYRCALGRGVGEELTPIEGGLKAAFVLAKPAFGVSTREVFAGIDECLEERDYDIDRLIVGIGAGCREEIRENMINDLELYTLEKYPEVKRLKQSVSETKDVEIAMMTGSGPTVMGVYRRLDAAKKAADVLRRQGYEAYWCSSGDGKK